MQRNNPKSGTAEEKIGAKTISRKEFIGTLSTALLGGLVMPALSVEGAPETKSGAIGIDRDGIPVIRQHPVTGIMLDPLLAPVDDFMLNALKTFRIPGAVCCITWDNKVIMNRGYGYCDPGCRKPTTPDTLMRVASCDKRLIKGSVLCLFQEKIRLPKSGNIITKDTRVFDALVKEYGIEPPPGRTVDPRIYNITLDQLLEHKSGIEQPENDWKVSDDLGLATPPTPVDYLRWSLSAPIRFEPGTKAEYNNTGYGVLKYFINVATGDWFEFARKTMFRPASVPDSQFILSRTDPRLKDPNESHYWSRGRGQSCVPGHNRQQVSLPNGAMNFDGWLCPTMTAEAYAKYFCHWAFDGGTKLINPATGRLDSKLGHGVGVYHGGMAGTIASVFQHRYLMMNMITFFNKGTDGDGGAAKFEVMDQIKKYLDKTVDHWKESKLRD